MNRIITFVLLIVAAALAAPLTVHAQDEDRQQREQKSVLEKERERLARLAKWAARTNATPREIFIRTYEPVVEGNKKDYERNMTLAVRYRDRAQDAISKGMEESARKYAALSRLFYNYAQVNRDIVMALQERDSKKLDEAFGKVKNIEQEIFTLSGRAYEREWVMPQELAGNIRPQAAPPAPTEPTQPPMNDTGEEGPGW